MKSVCLLTHTLLISMGFSSSKRWAVPVLAALAVCFGIGFFMLEKSLARKENEQDQAER